MRVQIVAGRRTLTLTVHTVSNALFPQKTSEQASETGASEKPVEKASEGGKESALIEMATKKAEDVSRRLQRRRFFV